MRSRNGLVLKLLLSLLLITQVYWVHASPSQLSLDASSLAVGSELSTYASFFEDIDGSLSLEDVSQTEYLALFEGVTQAPNFGFTESAWWAKFSLSNNIESPTRVFIRQSYQQIDYIDLYVKYKDGGITEFHTGDRLPFSSRPVDYREFLFPINLAANETVDVFVRFKSEGPVNITLEAHSDKSLLEFISIGQLAVGIYFGGFIILVLYNLCVLPSIKNESVLYYLLYFTSYGLYYAVHNGLTFQYFWPNSPALANKSLVFFLSLSLFFGIQFSRHFLNIKSFSTILDKFNYILALACLVFFVLTPFAGYQALIFPLSALTFLIIVNFMFIGIVALSKGVDSAFFYLLGWGALLVGVIAYMLKSFGVLPHNMWTQNGQQIGSLIEMVILSYALSRKISELQRDIYIDSLTGLSNRRYFDECLIKEFDEAITMAKGACSLLVIDIDNFKKFNDQYGHKMGDKALQSVGAILKKITRKYYIPCRYGGEEFSIILQNTSAEVANVIAERVRKNIECDKSFPYELSVSIGVATLLDKNFVDPQQFFEAADNAMYLAKNNGRNCVENYQAGLLRAATSC